MCWGDFLLCVFVHLSFYSHSSMVGVLGSLKVGMKKSVGGAWVVPILVMGIPSKQLVILVKDSNVWAVSRKWHRNWHRNVPEMVQCAAGGHGKKVFGDKYSTF